MESIDAERNNEKKAQNTDGDAEKSVIAPLGDR